MSEREAVRNYGSASVIALTEVVCRRRIDPKSIIVEFVESAAISSIGGTISHLVSHLERIKPSHAEDQARDHG